MATNIQNSLYGAWGYVDGTFGFISKESTYLTKDNLQDAVNDVIKDVDIDAELTSTDDGTLSLSVNGKPAGSVKIEDKYLSDVKLDEQAHELIFEISDGTKKVISTDTFVKDGMVESVVLADGKLTITFNTDAGKENVELELSEIFEADNYYSKTEVDGLFENVYTKEESDGKFLTEHQDISELATKEEVGEVEEKIPSLEGYATEEWVESKNYLTEHQDLSEYETSAHAEETYQEKGDYALVSQLPSVEGLATTEYVDGEVETLTTLVNDMKGDVYTKTEADEKFITEHQDISNLATKEEVETAVDDMATMTWVDEQNYLTEHQDLTDYETKEHAEETYQPKGDYPVYERYDNEAQNIHKKTITLENNDNISGKMLDGLSINLIEVSKWNVVDIGSKSATAVNLNSAYERPLYNDKHGIALLEDIDALKTELTDYFNAILKNYQFKSDNDIAKTMNGNDIVIAKDIKSDSGYTLTKKTNIDLNGHSLDAVSNGNYGDTLVVGNGGNVTISNGEIKPAENASVPSASATVLIKTAYESHLTLNNVKVTGIHPVYLNSANENTTVTINGGEFYTTMPLEEVTSDNMAPAVYVGKGSTGSTIGGKVTINGGTFGCKGVVNNFLLNVEDVLRKQEGKEPRNFIECFGGNYYNFNPADNKAEGVGTNFVADGYHVEREQDGDDVVYKVVKDDEMADN